MMRFLSGWIVNIPIAFTALRTNLMRSSLTVLGVMIGVFAVILAVAIGNGAKATIVESLNSMGQNMAVVFPIPDTGETMRRGMPERGRLTERDARAIQKLIPGVTAISPQLRSNVQLVTAGRNATTQAMAITPQHAIVGQMNTEQGRFISEADQRSAARVVVLGPSVAAKLFGGVDPLGREVRLNKVPFTVIGILESKGSSFGSDNDDMALVPLSTGRQRFASAGSEGPDDLNGLWVGFGNENDLREGKKEITKLLHDRNHVQPGELNPFTIRTTEEFMKQSTQITSILQGILVFMAGISLLVGGIGIMNIMLVSVTERTREIGLRMALGARRRDIRNQFLVEAAVLCVIGGIIGLLLAMLAGRFLEPILEFEVAFGLGITAFAILFSAGIGLAFGGYPAVRAARLSPIEALRSE